LPFLLALFLPTQTSCFRNVQSKKELILLSKGKALPVWVYAKKMKKNISLHWSDEPLSYPLRASSVLQQLYW